MKSTNFCARWLAALSLALVATGSALGHEAPASAPEPGLIQKAEHAVQHGVSAAASGVERGAKAAARGVEKGAQATANAVGTVAGKVGIDPSPAASSPAR